MPPLEVPTRSKPSLPWLAACAAALTLSCARAGTVAQGGAAPPQVVAEEAFRWEPWSPEAFERARRERRFILLNGAAEWCHWCHVMDETTWGDAAVRRELGRRFVAIRIDVGARPDLAERYGQGGWPATILFSPDAAEIGAFTGYLPPAQMLEILEKVDTIAALAADMAQAKLEIPAPDLGLVR